MVWAHDKMFIYAHSEMAYLFFGILNSQLCVRIMIATVTKVIYTNCLKIGEIANFSNWIGDALPLDLLLHWIQRCFPLERLSHTHHHGSLYSLAKFELCLHCCQSNYLKGYFFYFSWISIALHWKEGIDWYSFFQFINISIDFIYHHFYNII